MPVRDFLLDENGDLAVIGGDFAVVGDSARTPPAVLAWIALHFPGVSPEELAVVQSIKIRLRFFLAESYLDESRGVDWLGQILIKNADPLVVRELLRVAIASAPDVTQVVGAQLVQDAARQASIEYTVRTTYSTAEPITAEVTAP